MAKLKIEIEYDVTVKAILRGNDLDLALIASVPYGNRQAGATVKHFPEDKVKAVREALAALVGDDELEEVIRKAHANAQQAEGIALQRGETL